MQCLRSSCSESHLPRPGQRSPRDGAGIKITQEDNHAVDSLKMGAQNMLFGQRGSGNPTESSPRNTLTGYLSSNG